MKTSLIVVDYKTMKQTFRYLEHCSKMILDWEDVSVVIVDNDPDKAEDPFFTAGWENQTKTADEKIIGDGELWTGTLFGQPACYVRAQDNLGYAKGNNLGAAIAGRLFAPDYFLFSNNDIEFPEKISLKTLQEPFAKHGEAAAAGPAIVSAEGERQNPGKFRSAKTALFGGYWNMILPRSLQSDRYGTLASQTESGFCEWVSGSFFMADRQKFDEAEGFDTTTFLFMEEPILSRRLEKCGYRMYYTDQLKVIHAHGKTVKSTIGVVRGLRSNFRSEKHYYRTYENTPMLVIRCAELSFEIFILLFRIKQTIGNLLKRGHI